MSRPNSIDEHAFLYDEIAGDFRFTLLRLHLLFLHLV